MQGRPKHSRGVLGLSCSGLLSQLRLGLLVLLLLQSIASPGSQAPSSQGPLLGSVPAGHATHQRHRLAWPIALRLMPAAEAAAAPGSREHGNHAEDEQGGQQAQILATGEAVMSSSTAQAGGGAPYVSSPQLTTSSEVQLDSSQTRHGSSESLLGALQEDRGTAKAAWDPGGIDKEGVQLAEEEQAEVEEDGTALQDLGQPHQPPLSNRQVVMAGARAGALGEAGLGGQLHPDQLRRLLQVTCEFEQTACVPCLMPAARHAFATRRINSPVVS